MDAKRHSRPNCPKCGKPMRFTRLIPAIGALPELYSYYCDSCGESETQVGEPGERRDLVALSKPSRAVSRPA